MFKIESYVTPILLSYVDKYVKDFKPADAQVSLWGGGVILHNLVLKTDVLQDELPLPFTLVSGRIHELLINVPWTKIISEPIVVTIDTIECILSPRSVQPDEKVEPEEPREKTQVVEAPPGYMQALVRRIVSNIAIRVHHLILKYVHDDIVLSLNVKHLLVDSAGANWEPAFADIDQNKPVIRRLVTLDDLTLCLDSTDSDGKIRFYQDPLLYRCHLDFRVLIKLISANTRRANGINIQMRSAKIAWGVTSDQLKLLMRLVEEQAVAVVPTLAKLTTKSLEIQQSPTKVVVTSTSNSSNSAEPARPESWSSWAWSWMPSWMEGGVGIEEAPAPAQPTPIFLTAFVDEFSIIFKWLELDSGKRKRFRSILELTASHAAVKSSICRPTQLNFKIGVRNLVLLSYGKCSCGHIDIVSMDEPIVFLAKKELAETEDNWKWPQNELNVETLETDDDVYYNEFNRKISTPVLEKSTDVDLGSEGHKRKQVSDLEMTLHANKDSSEDSERLWKEMKPMIFIFFTHERSPAEPFTNPFENPPTDFEYSDWEEQCDMSIHIKPIQLRVCMGLIHRLQTLQNILSVFTKKRPARQVRKLTVEECDALLDNLPQKQINVEIKNLHLRVYPWDHTVDKRETATSLLLNVTFPRGNFVITTPLYPLRVCSAMCQVSVDAGPLWRGARQHFSASLSGVQVSISSIDEQPKPCAFVDIRIVIHTLLCQEYFADKQSVLFSYTLKLRDANISGSAARMQAAAEVVSSLVNQRASNLLRYTSLANDALNDENQVVLDITLEDLALRGFFTKNVTTYIMTLQSVRATVFHSPDAKKLRQAWLFSGPDIPTNKAFLRFAVQWCKWEFNGAMDYFGLWTEPAALCMDPLFIAWLSYQPVQKCPESSTKTLAKSQFIFVSQAPSSSSGRRSLNAEQVHQRSRSIDSSTEYSEKKEQKRIPSVGELPSDTGLLGQNLVNLHGRLQKMLVCADLGLILVYVTTKTVSAVDCATVRVAMEQHAINVQPVMVFSVGRWSMFASSITSSLWHTINRDGPSYYSAKNKPPEDSFPWKMALADMSCYSIEPSISMATPQESSKGLRSQLKTTLNVRLRTVVELVTTVVTLTVAKKTLPQRMGIKKIEPRKTEPPESLEQRKMKYFTRGSQFKPASLNEFIRGPLRNTREETKECIESPESPNTKPQTSGPSPIVSFGFNLHADTPPIIVTMEQDQVHLVAASLHCFSHVIALLTQPPITIVKTNIGRGASQKYSNRSVSDLDEVTSITDTTRSEDRSELLTIFEARPKRRDKTMKTFFYCQWVIGEASLTLATDKVKIVFEVEDIITTVDIQEFYQQMKLKISSASIKQYEREQNLWNPGSLGGRVLAIRDGIFQDDSNFFSVTITRTQVSELPESWKTELHPKLMEQKPGDPDTIWEIYAILAPLEIAIGSSFLKNIMSISKTMTTRTYCSLSTKETGQVTTNFPFIYIHAGGLWLLFHSDIPEGSKDDTFILSIDQISLNPHPENPICRRQVMDSEVSWPALSGSLEGRQYEVTVENISIKSVRFAEILTHEESNSPDTPGRENPACKWSYETSEPALTTVLHPLNVNFVIAPTLFVGGVLACGPGFELNMTSDCSIELSVDQLQLAFNSVKNIQHHINNRMSASSVVIKEGLCPYAPFLLNQNSMPEPDSSKQNEALNDDADMSPRTVEDSDPAARIATEQDANGTYIMAEDITSLHSGSGKQFEAVSATVNYSAINPITLDSGVETATSISTLKSDANFETPTKKHISVAFAEKKFDVSEHLEVLITMGVIEFSLYTVDDGSEEINVLKPGVVHVSPSAETDSSEQIPNEDPISRGYVKNDNTEVRMTRTDSGNVPLFHITFYQPNFYYWKRRTQRNIQVSLFNAWIGLGMGLLEGHWHANVMSTTGGVPDPDTEIPPALLTIKYSSASVGTPLNHSPRGVLNVEVERPVMFELSSDSIYRFAGIHKLLKDALKPNIPENTVPIETGTQMHPIYKLRRFLVQFGIETATIRTSQLGLTGADGVIGCESTSLQLAWTGRPGKVVVRGLVSGLLIASGPFASPRQPVLHPLHVGIFMEALWEAWRRTEAASSSKEPTVRLNVDLDRVIFDLQPDNLYALVNIMQILKEITSKEEKSNENSDYEPQKSSDTQLKEDFVTYSSYSTPEGPCDQNDHYYKDDLRSGAFQVVTGGQLPMAYQVMLNRKVVSWRYPHPRAITRLILFPLPDQDTELDGVLEFYNWALNEWEVHTYIKLPVSEPREVSLQAQPPEILFAATWRFRVISELQETPRFFFDLNKFVPKTDPWIMEGDPNYEPESSIDITAEQLSGILRVDSYFAPRLAPRLKISIRFAELEIHAHNSLPNINSRSTALEGYYVSKPLMRSHRMVSIIAVDTSIRTLLDSPAGTLILLNSNLSCDILECSTGTMNHAVDSFKLQAGISIPDGDFSNSRVRVYSTGINMYMHIPRLRSLQALAKDWITVLNDCFSMESNKKPDTNQVKPKKKLAAETAILMEGRVSLWIHNSCSIALRVGQEGTDEIVTIDTDVTLAYRWCKLSQPKRLRFAYARTSTDWLWSKGVPFIVGESRVRLEDQESLKVSNASEFLYVQVKQVGAHRNMHLAGHLVLANMLRLDLVYKVRSLVSDNAWRTLSSGVLNTEDSNRSIVCSSNNEMVLKLKFMHHDVGWSGGIPLRECPKENVPWLVKVPSDGELPYISVWCRVVRARAEGRILATIWPLYILYSNLSLDTDMLLVTEPAAKLVTKNKTGEATETKSPPPLIQTVVGRGTSTHLLAPGTTSARHSLSFQYRNIDSPVTREAVPLHYGVTDSSVFEKHGPVNKIDDVLQEITSWLERSGQSAVSSWPYSIVTKHWSGEWQPALLQPRCDVAVRYLAVRAGGGCSLEVQLNPVVLICNATTISLTMRAYDAAPLCKMEPGTVISLPSIILKKPFFLSIDMDRETFVSNQLELSSLEPGRYGSPAAGQVAVDHSTTFAIACTYQVALVNLHYEIKEAINVLGLTTTFVFVNNLDMDVMVAPIVTTFDTDDGRLIVQPKFFKTMHPIKMETFPTVPLCRFWLLKPWRGGPATELKTFLSFTLSSKPCSESSVPVRIGAGPVRKAIALMDNNHKSVPVVVTQHKHDNRWVVTVSKDPCPRYLITNHTHVQIAVGQPRHDCLDSPVAEVQVDQDCLGARWWCIVPQNITMHYSASTHPVPLDSKSSIPFLTFAPMFDVNVKPIWCPIVALTDGEQLVHLAITLTIKIRVRTYPHSTMIELRDVDRHDLSASEIRRRITGSFSNDMLGKKLKTEQHQKLIKSSKCKESLFLKSKSLREQFRITQEEFQQKYRDIQSLSSMQDVDTALIAFEESGTFEKKNIIENDESDITVDQIVSAKKVANQNEVESEKRSLGIGTPSSFEPSGSSVQPHSYNADASSSQTTVTLARRSIASDASSAPYPNMNVCEWEKRSFVKFERIRCIVAGIVIKMAAGSDTPPLFALNFDNVTFLLCTSKEIIETRLSIENVQIDNLQYDSGQFDFAVIATTQVDLKSRETMPTTWNIFTEQYFGSQHEDTRIILKACHDKWTVQNNRYCELTEIEVLTGPLALYIEDAYVTALVELFRLTFPPNKEDEIDFMAEARSLQKPLRLRLLCIYPLDLTLTLHTAVRMYIALDQSPLQLSAFRLEHMFTSPDRLAHSLTVHYLSAAILGAGWVVGGLELLGAPGALVSRVGGATGGVRGIASTAAAALLRSLSAWAGSLARNLDLLAGDEDHARRAAAARRRPPDSFMGGLLAGITNFAINILGAVGGLAHHPLVGVAVGETESSTAALRRGLLGALTKPLSATADLVAYAGHGLLKQTGWDPVPQPRASLSEWREHLSTAGWRRDSVRWTFRLADLVVFAGFEVLLDNMPLQIMLTHKFLIIADADCERVLEMIEFRNCTLGPCQASIVELYVSTAQKRFARLADYRAEREGAQDNEDQIKAAAMARVARFTGTEGSSNEVSRILYLLPKIGQAYNLHAAISACIRNNSNTHFPLM